MMLIKLAWKNIWRNRTRSFVVVIATALGLWAGIFASAFVQGMMEGKINSVIEKELSHFQFHHPVFSDEYLARYIIPNDDAIIEELSLEENVEAIAPRLISLAMIASPKKSGSIKVNGVLPENEAKVTALDTRLVEGSFFTEDKKNQVLISGKTAEQYNVKLRSKIVLTVQDVNQDIIAGAFRVCGIYTSDNPMFDEMNLYVRQSDLRKLVNLDKGLHEIAVLLDNHDLADPMADAYQEKYPDLAVEAWLDISTGMRYMVEAFDTYVYFIVGIILLALILSIVNTMLMAVLERTREIGMLMAIGMNKLRLFSLILIETIFLSLIGGPIGLFIAWMTIQYFGKKGIDLAGAAYGDMGFGNVVYPFLTQESYLGVSMMVIIMAILSAIYPAIKALKLKPVEALRTE